MQIFNPHILKGKVAFITGGGSGICMGITRAFLEHGAVCSIASRNKEKLKAAASLLSAQTGSECIAVQADVRNANELVQAVEATVKAFGKIDIVICGAAGNFLALAEGMSANAFKTVIDIDLIGTFNTLKAAFPELKKTKGCIINISATLHYTGSPFQAHAVSAKAGIDAMTKTLAVEWGRYGVRINCIAPGPIEDTEGFRKLTPKDMDRSLVSRMVPLGTFGKIQDIENAALFLTSEGGRWITGAVMVVDGGSWLGGDEPFRTSFGNNLSKL